MREPIKDGEIRPSKNGVAFVLGVWQSGDNIEIVLENGFKTSVNNNEDSVRYHRNLYKHLKNLLQENGKWQD
ncbi:MULTISPECIES: hypothetical protein [Bacillus]|uniref:hypothetical protein n=1 Tax=Bacillus TaxID=1386 RepID=UPI00211244E1|nr:hypothetical protein [Bacillus paranthracis]MCQ6520964.1 hypothetical protein [Bacillus paranthracis]MCU5231299.1 hypothetical protein [Bacillus paranthracis]MEC4604774.1 hypothetical protein [Bacillus paranthracis]